VAVGGPVAASVARAACRSAAEPTAPWSDNAFDRPAPRCGVDATQEEFANPFGMDEDCRNCPELADCRTSLVHGYGDVGAEFLIVGEAPTAGADRTGVPFTGDAAGERLQYVLGELGLSRSPPAATEPDVQNVFMTYLTRCRHPERPPTDVELANCEPFLNAEIRTINPEIIVTVGQRPLEALAIEYTTRAPDSFDVAAEHATTVRGRGFEIVPMVALDEQTDAQTDSFLEHMLENVLSRDYRQTKGRRSR
jgi:uracil-DNA glycosylase family 4